MNWKNELASWFKEHEKEGVELLGNLVRQNTVNPPGNEYLAAEVVGAYLQGYGSPSTTHEAEQGRTNLLAKVGDGSPVVFVPAHTDVVPPCDGWDTNPFEPVVRDGYMYGRGTVDDKGPLVSLLLLAAFLKQHEGEFRGTLLVGAVADEEAGSAKGVSFLLEQGIVSADFAIVPDTGESIYRVSCGEKGLLHVEIIFHGKQAHSSAPEEGLNAVWAANAFLDEVRALFGDVAGYCTEAPHELFSQTTIGVAKIEAGSAFNIIPKECKLWLDVRYTPERTREELMQLFERIARNVKDRGLCASFDVREDNHMLPFVIDQQSPLVRAVTEAVGALGDISAQRFGMSATTVCKQLLEHGIPALGFSQDGAGQMHIVNERLKLSEIGLFGRALGLAFLYLGGN